MQRQANLSSSSFLVAGAPGGLRSATVLILRVSDPSRADRANLKRSLLAVISALLFYLAMLSTPAHATGYSTNFPNAEPLISEGGHWITAGTPGVNWSMTMTGGKGDRHVSSVSTTPGYAFGPIGPELFGDALALLTGSWNPDQMAEATVREISPTHRSEVEIRLRTSPKDATGYEIMWSALGPNGVPYLAIATWNGPSSAPPHWTSLKALNGPDYGVATGDVVKAVIVGNTITVYKNGKQQLQITDNTFSKGNPGFGFNQGPNGTYGITSFTASDSGSQVPDPTTSYTTNFPKTESPISEGGRWIGGKTVGLDWGDVSTTPGYATGHAGPKRFADSVALLTGDWPANQSVEEVVDRRKVSRYPEVSMRLRSSLAKHNCDGYEISYSLKDDDTAYLIIVRWNGALADFTYLVNTKGKQYAVKTGDVVKATIVGNEIKTYKNGVLMGSSKDNTYIHGNPGFGFNEGVNGDYGISSFSATATDATTF